MLEARQIVHLLLDRGLISAKQIVDSNLKIVDCSRRNRNFKVLVGAHRSYLVKQGITNEKRNTVRHEAKVYALINAAHSEHDLRRLMPRLYSTAFEDSLLVLGLDNRAQNIREYHEAPHQFPALVAKALAAAVATIHRAYFPCDADNQPLTSDPPHGLSLHHPDLTFFRHASEGSLKIVMMIGQSPRLAAGVDELREQWTPTAFIHSDLRWENCLVKSPVAQGQGWPRVKVVDWELARRGDPAWDVGTVFAEYLSFWIFSAPLSELTPPESFLKFARHPIERMRPAIRAFWNSYKRLALADDAGLQETFFLRAVRCAAARLVQTAFESVQDETDVTPPAVFLLQLGENMFNRVPEVGPLLLGIHTA